LGVAGKNAAARSVPASRGDHESNGRSTAAYKPGEERKRLIEKKTDAPLKKPSETAKETDESIL